jgi:pSer/pThr/pTyr-binding forkhead associated (FHA) protein
MTKLFIVEGPEKGQSFKIKGDIAYVGRSSDNDIQMKDRSVSRKHLKILKKSNQYFIEDLQSANGTFVDGKPLFSGDEFEVKEGLPITIGNMVVCLGKEYKGDVPAIPEPMDLSKEIKQKEKGVTKERRTDRKKNMELISKVSDLFMQSMDIKETLETILDYVSDLLNRIDRGIILLVDHETGKISDVISIIKKSSDDTTTIYSRTVVDQVLRDGAPVIISDTHAEAESDFSASLKLMKIRSVMCVPLISGSIVRGVIYLDSVNKPNGFRKEDLSLLTSLSGPAALAVENALLFSNLERIVEDGQKICEKLKKIRESG